ncbi:Aste57867_11904 [Aphanomyces stellatus]|uniref:Aste57867_11904 protein n=1 Tax=Aphanomyces stellatus TaxID=120398 RepID=A0A485KUA0_9STRA|nr:hypothetical protein As57867_011859 [Aphanomyces stellatus]VFT88759.1 Aste57867_11904 [Aphanomyces stellatus]
MYQPDGVPSGPAKRAVTAKAHFVSGSTRRGDFKSSIRPAGQRGRPTIGEDVGSLIESRTRDNDCGGWKKFNTTNDTTSEESIIGTVNTTTPTPASREVTVPVVAGKNQSEAVGVQKKHKFALQTAFSPRKDTLSTDMAAAYDVPSLSSLQRTVAFDRSALGSISIQDTVVMKDCRAVDFEAAFKVLGHLVQTIETRPIYRITSIK